MGEGSQELRLGRGLGGEPGVPDDIPMPLAPHGLDVVLRGPDQVRLEFSCSDEQAAAYTALRLGAGGLRSLGVVSAGEGRCRFEDTAVSADQRHCYRVTLDAFGEHYGTPSVCTYTDPVLEYSLAPRARQGHDAWQPWSGTYRAAYARPESWSMRLSACDYGYDATRYRWEVLQSDGRAIVTPYASDCEAEVALTELGWTRVSLILEDRFGRPTRHERTIYPRDVVVVSLGGAVAAGEGQPTVDGEYRFRVHTDSHGHPVYADVQVAREAQWIDDACHRSRGSAHARAAEARESRDHHTSITFLSYACSGATLAEVTHASQLQGQPPQLARAREDLCDGADCRTVDTVLLTAGRLTVDFPGFVDRCADGSGGCPTAASQLGADAHRLGGRIAALDVALRDTLSPRRVITLEAPDERLADCAELTRLDADERSVVRQGADRIAAAAAQAAADAGWVSVDVSASPNASCASYNVSSSAVFRRQGDTAGWLQPSAAGAWLMGHTAADHLVPPAWLVPVLDTPLRRFGSF